MTVCVCVCVCVCVSEVSERECVLGRRVKLIDSNYGILPLCH